MHLTVQYDCSETSKYFSMALSLSRMQGGGVVTNDIGQVTMKERSYKQQEEI